MCENVEMSQMEDSINEFVEPVQKPKPWKNVPSIHRFSTFNCPECNFVSKEEEIFHVHAFQNHL